MNKQIIPFFILAAICLAGCDSSDKEPSPDETASADVGRYQIYTNPVDGGMRNHILLDTATGQVWTCAIGGADMKQMNFGQPVGWLATAIVPPIEVKVPEVGRFSVSSSFSYGADSFLLDSATGKVYLPIVNDNKFEFHQLEVQSLHEKK